MDSDRNDRYRDHAAHCYVAKNCGRSGGGAAMTFDIGMPMLPEAVLFGFMVLVLFVGLLRKAAPNPEARIPNPGQAPFIGWLSIVGLLVTFTLTLFARENATLFSNSFVNDSLALFSKKLFTAAAALS